MHKGLSFIPSTNKPDPKDTRADLDRLRRSINLRIFWGLRDDPSNLQSLLSKHRKSDWDPPQYITHTTCWEKAERALNSHLTQSPNLSTKGIEACTSLHKDNETYTIKADKGGKTVTWKRADYLAEARRQLSDSNTYKELSKQEADNALIDIATQRNLLALALYRKNYITKLEYNSLTGRPAQASAIYFLPKIHKDKRPDTGTFPGRPILAAMKSTTRDIDLFLADLTQPLLKHIPGSLQDTTTLINDMETLSGITTGHTLFSADVVSLYPSIPWEEGIAAATRFYSKHFFRLTRKATIDNKLQPPNPMLFRMMLTLVLKNNIIHLQNTQWFHQLSGTAMGCSISVYFANTYMYYRTHHLVHSPPPDLLYLGRYIDDIIGVWKGDKKLITSLFNNVIDNHLQLTFVISDEPLEALDLRLTIAGEKILCRLFRKPTEGHQYVHHTSMHPPALLRSLPYSQLLRIRRNSTLTEDFDIETIKLLERFSLRGYPYNTLLRAYIKTLFRPRKNLLRPVDRPPNEDRLHFVTTFFNSQPNTRTILNTLFKELGPTLAEYNEQLKKPIPTAPPRIAYRAHKRIGDGLGTIYKQGPKSELNSQGLPASL